MSQLLRYFSNSGPGSFVQTLTADTGGAIDPSNGNINLFGGNNITTVGNFATSTITFSVTGTTNHSVLLGNATGSINSLTNGTTGQVLLANTGADPSWGAVPTSGFVTSVSGNNNITITGTASAPIVNVSGTTNHSVIVGNSTGSLTSIAVGTSGTVLTGVTGADPVFAAPAASSISITGDSGGALVGNSFLFHGGTTGLSFNGSGLTETLQFAGITANGGTVSLATDATTSSLNIGTGAGVKTTVLGSTNTTSTTTIQSGSNPLTLTTNGGNANIVLTPNGTGVVTTANNLRAASISFDGGTNLLSSYVNWTSWTPTANGTTPGTTSYTVQFGTYTRIGNLVTAQFQVSYSGTTGTGSLQIGGLPLAIANVANYVPTGAVSVGGPTFPALTTYLTLYGNLNTTTFLILGSGSLLGNAFLQIANVATTIIGTLTYRV